MCRVKTPLWANGDSFHPAPTGACITGNNPANYDCNNDFLWHKSPGTLQFEAVENIAFTQCEFRHMGGECGMGCSRRQRGTVKMVPTCRTIVQVLHWILAVGRTFVVSTAATFTTFRVPLFRY
jgi:hypothetical protein